MKNPNVLNSLFMFLGLCIPSCASSLSNTQDQFVGEYAVSYFANKTLSVSQTNGSLYVRFNKGNAHKLILKSDYHYEIEGVSTEIVFLESNKDACPSLTLFRKGRNMVFTRLSLLQSEYRKIAKKVRPNGLSDAILMKDAEAVKTLIAKGADVMELDTRRYIAGKNGRRPLNWAAIENHTESIKLLLDAGADIHGTNLSGFTPLHHAAEAGSLEAVELLLKHGADKHLKTKKGRTPIEIAAIFDHRPLFPLLDIPE